MHKTDLKILNRQEIDDEKWNEIIEKHSHGMLYGFTWYLDIVSPNWKGLIIKDYETIMPITWRTKYGITYLFQPFFCQQLGLFGNIEHLNSVIYFLKKKYAHINIQLNYQNHLKNQKNNFVLNTSLEYSLLKSQYSSQTTRNLKKAENYNLDIKYNLNFDIAIDFFIENKHTEVEKLNLSDYEILKILCNSASKKGLLKVVDISIENEILCSAIFFYNLQRTTLIMLSSSEKGKTHHASTFLIDKIIQDLSTKNQILDFEGSSIDGLIRFYSGFGAINEPFGILHKSFFGLK